MGDDITKITIINFSGRSNGNCHDIACVIEQSLQTDNEITLIEMFNQDIKPCGECNYECFNMNSDCPYFKDDIYIIYSLICSSDFVFYVVPNYCDYPNANFFIFNERSQCFFQKRSDMLFKYEQVKKKFIVVSNTGKDNFLKAFQYHVDDNREADVLFLASRDFDKRSINGDLMSSEQAKSVVETFAKE